MTHPDYLWAGQGWPMTDDDHEFLVPAFNRIGRHIHGDQWRDDYPTLNPLEVKAQRVEDAAPEERAWAHRILSAVYPETYKEDYESPPAPPTATGVLASLGSDRPPQTQLGSLLGSAYPPGRPSGWWFSQEDWEKFRAAVHYLNEKQKPKIKMVNDTARWLFNRIVRGEVVPFVQHQQGGGWTPSTVDDWRMPTPEHLRKRIQRCMMVPGRSAVPAGTHWIIINKAELSAAIEKDRNSANVSAPSIESVALGEGLLTDSSDAAADLDEVADKQAYWRKHKVEIMQAAEAYVREHGDRTRKGGLTRHLKGRWSELTPNWINTKVWPPLARDKPELSAPGNRRGSRHV